MKKILSVIMMVFLALPYAKSGEPRIDVSPVEVEVSWAIHGSIDGTHDDGYTMYIIPIPNLEARYNLPKGFDAGIKVGLTSAGQSYLLDVTADGKKVGWSKDNSSFYFALLGDYNFRRGRKVNPFVGIGAGLALNVVEQGHEGDGLGITNAKDELHAGGWFMPRVGVELWHGLRITASLGITRKAYNTWSLSVGWTFGGRPKKK